MRRFILTLTAIGTLLASSINVQAQQVSYGFGKDLKWRLGFNTGMHYQSSDVRSKNGIGLGATLERSLIMGDSPFGLSLRGQYFWGNSYGLGTERFNGIQNNSDLNGDRNLDYTSLGYVYNNHSTDIHELSLEALFYLSRPYKKNAGFLLYLYGGIGGAGYKARMDQFNSFTNSEYDYSQISSSSFNFSTKNDLEALLDGDYETLVDGQTRRQWILTPSIGLGWGFQISPRVSFSFEHKMNFTGVDVLDGNKYNEFGELDDNNDKYHYTTMMWGIGLGKGGSGKTKVTTNNNTKQPTPFPVVEIINPSVSPSEVSDCKAYIMAKIYNINGKANIRVTKDGQNVSAIYYTYDENSRIFELNHDMKNKGGVYKIKAFNSSGSGEDQVTIICKKTTTTTDPVVKITPPTVKITNPSVKVFNAPTCNAAVTARITGVTDPKDVKVFLNGQQIPRNQYTFTPSSGFLTLNTAIDGNTEITVGATNGGGAATDMVTINCTPKKVILPPKVNITNPNVAIYNSEDCNANVTVYITNIDNSDGITVARNGITLGNTFYNYNTSNGKLTINEPVEGSHAYTITATNEAGTDAGSVTINCTPPRIVPPVVRFINPAFSPTVTKDCNYNVQVKVTEIKDESGITVYVNGSQLSRGDYSFNAASGMLTFYRTIVGYAKIKVVATNDAGTDEASTTITCKPAILSKPKPRVIITNPGTSPYTTSDCNINFTAQIQNVKTQMSVNVYVDNKRIYPPAYDFNVSTGTLTMNRTINGESTIRVTAKTLTGTDTKTAKIICKPAVVNKPKPIVTFTNPAANPHVTSNCNMNFSARVQNVRRKSNVDVFVNGQKLAEAAFNFNPTTGNVTFSRTIDGEANVKISVRNPMGFASDSRKVVCKPVVTNPKPTVVITTPATSPYFTPDCNIMVVAMVTNARDRSDITIKENNFTLFSSKWSYDESSGQIVINKKILCETTFTITVNNGQGSASASVTVDCNYGRTPSNPAPTVTVVKPINNPHVTTTCNTPIEVRVTEVRSKYDIQVRRNGKALTSNKYNFNSVSGMLTLTETEEGEFNYTVTATNDEGSDSKSFTIKCAPPVINKPTVNITSPSGSNNTVTDCKINVTATTTEITEKSQVTVTNNGQPVNFTFSNGTVRISNVAFDNNANIKITVTNQGGSASDDVKFTCQKPEKKITICHYPPGNKNNPQEIEISENAWPAHEAHGDTKGACPVIVKPTVNITSPSGSNNTVTDCKINVTATTTEITEKSQVAVTNNGQPVNFTFSNGTVRISNVAFDNNANIKITVTNQGGSASDDVKFTCQKPEKKITICHYPPGNKNNPQEIEISENAWPAHEAHGDTKGACPVIVKPTVNITSPSGSNNTVTDCKINVTATTTEITEKSQVTVTNNGQPVNFTISNGTVRISNIAFDNNASIKITVTNQGGSASDEVKFTCDPQIQICLNGQPKTIKQSEWNQYKAQGATQGACPVIVKPTVNITSPSGSNNTVTDCKINVTATTTEITEKSQVTVTNNGQPVNFTFSNGTVKISNVAFDNNANIKITVTNQGGSATDNINFTCQKPEKKITICHYPPGNKNNPQEIEISENAWPAHEAHGDTKGACPVIVKPTVNITSPSGSNNTVTDCKINVTATTTEITEKSQVTVTNNGQPVNFTFGNGTVRISNVAFENTSNIKITVTNQGGSATDNVNFTCQKPEKKITICHYPPGNKNNPQEIEISENAWPAHEAHGDTKGACPVIVKPTVNITSPSGSNNTVTDCKINVTATTTEITEKSQVTVTNNGQPVNFTFGNGTVRISNVAFENTSNIKITVTNQGGSATNNVNFTCQKPEKKITICHYPPGNKNNPQEIEISENAWPAHEAHGDTKGACPVINKPTVNITSPSGSNNTVTDCKINVTATTTEITQKSQVTVTNNGQPVNFTFSNGTVRISNVAFENTSNIKITVTNQGGSASDEVKFTCEAFDFNIENGSVKPNHKFNANVKVLGCALKAGGTGADYPVMVQVRFGNNTVDPFGKYAGYNAGSNVNDHKQHNWNSNSPIAANTAITVKAKSYSPSKQNSPLYEYNSSTHTSFVKVLRNGDDYPKVSGFKGQQDAEEYLKDYIENGKIKLQPNQAIYLFELGTNKTNVQWYDLQDCVVLVTLTPAN